MKDSEQERLDRAIADRVRACAKGARENLENAIIAAESERRFAAAVAARLPDATPQKNHYEEMSTQLSLRVGQLQLELTAVAAEHDKLMSEAPPPAPKPEDKPIELPANTAATTNGIPRETTKETVPKAAAPATSHKERRK